MNTTTANAVRGVLEAALSTDPDVVLLGETVGRAGGADGCTAGLLEQFGADRVRDLPVADRGTVALAVGMALGGRRPVVELSGPSRLPAALEAIAEAASVASVGEFRVPLVIRVPTGGEAGPRLDRPVADLLASVDGLRVVCASSPSTGAGLLRSALSAGGPVVILAPRAVTEARGDVRADAVPLDRARVVRQGDHVTLLAWGAGVSAALSAAESLAAEGVSAGVVDLVSLSPVDRATVGAEARRTGRAVAVHDGDAGFAERLLRVGLHEAFLFLESPPAAAPASPDAIVAAARASVHY